MSLLKLNPELFKYAKNEDDFVGDLNVPKIMRHFLFKEVKRATDNSRGEVVHCTFNGFHSDLIKNDSSIKEVRFEGEIILLAKDLIPA